MVTKEQLETKLVEMEEKLAEVERLGIVVPPNELEEFKRLVADTRETIELLKAMSSKQQPTN